MRESLEGGEIKERAGENEIEKMREREATGNGSETERERETDVERQREIDRCKETERGSGRR